MITYSKKKAMSLAEVLVSLAVVGVLAIILVPLMLKSTTNKEKFLYKKAINSMQNAISAVMSEYEAVNAANFLPELSQNEDIRAQFASKLNAKGTVRTGDGAGSAANPDFTSADGMTWWNIPTKWTPGENYIDVNVDVNGDNGKNIASDDAASTDKPDQLKIRIMKDGRVVVPEIRADDDKDWTFEMEYLMSQTAKDN